MIDAIYTEPPAGVKESTRDIEMRDGFQSELRIHSPTEPPKGGSPLIVLVFGGGWCVSLACQSGGMITKSRRWAKTGQTHP